MKPVQIHSPGEPSCQGPPDRLVGLADGVRDPLVFRTGLTTTADGRWALYVTVPADATVPIPSVEAQAGGYPVVYEAEPDSPPLAGPARPARRRKQTP